MTIVGQVGRSIAARYREWKSRGAGRALAGMSRADVASLASDLGMCEADLRQVVARGEGAGPLMREMMRDQGIDPDLLKAQHPVAAREIAAVCSRCEAKTRCRRELTVGTAAQNAESFCPNAASFSSLVRPA